MPEQSPLTLGLTPPLLRGIGVRKPLTQHQAIELLTRTARWIKTRVPALHVNVTEGTGSVTIYLKVTGGRP